MRTSTSLTEAVKQAAAGGASLTDAVKDAAREFRETRETLDCTIISFPRNALDGRHDGSQGGRHPWGPTPAVGGRTARTSEAGGEPEAREPIPKPGLSRRAGAGSRPRLSRRDGSETRPAAPGRKIPFAAPALRFLAGGARLAGIVLLSCVSLVATPSMLGSDGPVPAAAERRVALVIGNSAYRHTRRLENPRNDATDIGAALKKLGFEVIEGFDLDKAALEAKIRDFTVFLRGADVGVFFYAGHGLHVAGHNYLVPVDAQLTAVSALDLELVPLDRIHRTMEREAATSLLFFDACRANPLSDNLARAMGTRSVDIGRGLAVVRSGAGTLISFSTQPGTLALDGKGRNSPYSGALVRQLAASNDDLAAILIAVRNDVMRETDRKQVPWEHSALTGRFYFKPGAEMPAPASATPSKSREAYEAWSAARDTTFIGVLEAFIARYRDTFYAELARARIEELKKLDTSLPSLAGAAPSSIR